MPRLVLFATLAAPALSMPALAQNDRLPPPPPSTTIAPFTFADAYRAAGNPIIAVVDFYVPDRADARNDLFPQSRLLAVRAREFLRSTQAAMVAEDLTSRAAADVGAESLAGIDPRRAAHLIAGQTRADVVLLLVSEARTADGAPNLHTSYQIVDVRRDALVADGTFEITPGPGRSAIDAERLASFARLIGADAQQRFTGFYRSAPAPAALAAPVAPAPSAYSQPLTSAPVQTVQAPAVVQQPVYTPQPVVVQQPVYTTPVYTTPVIVRQPVVVSEPVYVPTSSWAVSVGYGWGSGHVGFGYGSGWPGYYAPAYRPAYCGWGGYPYGGSAFALSLNFSNGGHGYYGGHGGHGGGGHGGGGHGGGGHGGHH